jgi:uncharacterized protein
MNHPFRKSVALISSLVFCLALCAFGESSITGGDQSAEALPPAPSNYFNDYAGMTSAAARDSLNRRLADFDKQTTNQIVVAIFETKTSPAPLADYCTSIFDAWKVGQKNKNNGVVLFIFKKERLLRIATGRGMETMLPDAECKRILEEIVTPAFRKGDFDTGLANAINAIIKDIQTK